MTFPSLYSYLSYTIFIAVVLFSACQSDPKTVSTSPKEVPNMTAGEKLYAHYYVRYLADEKKMKAEASFFIRAGKQKRNPKTFNEVSLGGKGMHLDNTSKASPYYKLEQNESPTNKGKFQFISKQGTKEEDLISIPTLESISFGKQLSRSKNGLLSWKGEPLGDKESLVLLFTNEQERTTSTVINGPSEKSELSIPLEKLQKIGLGGNRVYIVRKSRAIENKRGSDGMPREVRVLTEFYSETMELEVVE
jgi:hypothetical protein